MPLAAVEVNKDIYIDREPLQKKALDQTNLFLLLKFYIKFFLTCEEIVWC